jgi:hypothetical protein
MELLAKWLSDLRKQAPPGVLQRARVAILSRSTLVEGLLTFDSSPLVVPNVA